jgi:cytochrome c oxidase subunit 2
MQMKPGGNPGDRNHLIAVAAIAAALSAGLAYLFFHVDLIPHPASAERQAIDSFIRLLFTIASVFFAVIATVLTYELVFFRRRRGDTGSGPPIRGNPPLELVWTALPLLIIIGLAVHGSMVLSQMDAPGPPQSELVVEVTASRFVWQFQYPEFGISSYELGLPVGRRVLFNIRSTDVVHSFWVQEFGPKQDAVPGVTTQLRITPTEVGQYTLVCSQLCGEGHSYMMAPVRVMSSADFQDWVSRQQQQQQPTPQPAGP